MTRLSLASAEDRLPALRAGVARLIETERDSK